MSDELREQIYDNMNLKETDELINIWQTNDRVEWSDTAFQVVNEILLGRISAIPPQNPPITKHPEPHLPFILQNGQQKGYDFPVNMPLRITTASFSALLFFFIIILIINPGLINSSVLPYFFFLSFGVCVSIVGCIYTYYAWTLDAERFVEWNRSQRVFRYPGQTKVPRLFSSYQLWSNRLASPLAVICGVTAIGVALLSLAATLLKQ